MTTKPKTRKAVAAKRAAPKAATKQTPGKPKREVSVICKLISRWHWLEADHKYLLETEIDEEADRLTVSHRKEKRNIEVRLSKLVPRDLWQVMHLLEFAAEMVEQGGSGDDDLEVNMLKNAKEGVRLVWSRTECEAERIKFLAARADQAA
jgi:hypothetical protein